MIDGVTADDPAQVYAQRLRAWNASAKYRAELTLLGLLLDLAPGMRVLDVGCGTGMAVEHLAARTGADVEGFDVTRLVEGSPVWYRGSLDGAGRYDAIYLLHSLAHIPDAPAALATLVRDHLVEGGKLVVITPNADFDEHMKSLPRSTPYVADATVHRHYTQDGLTALLDEAGLDVTVAGRAGKRAGGHHERLFAVAVRATDAATDDAWSITYGHRATPPAD